ncbi:MAG: D-alanine--D-alanine ligase family protein [Planctomycetota bacterium]|jgi:D-alanine-D-alanine ligase
MVVEPSADSRFAAVNSRLKVAVLTGGIGEERDISIQSGDCVTQALKEAGLDVVAFDVCPDNIGMLEEAGVDVFFVALHGRFGEDGQLQQVLEDKSLVYTGSGPEASRLAFDKMAGKGCFVRAGVTTPKAVKFDVHARAKDLEARILQLGKRFVVKPLRQGSTIGVSIVDDPKSAIAAARECSARFGDCMIEQFVPGREVTVGILQNRTLPLIEIRTERDFYDFRAKYLDGRTEFLFDTIDDPRLTAKIEAAALDCFNSLGCRHFGRVDLILGDDARAYALEVNTIPGFTDHSLLPPAAARVGLSMSDLCLKIVDEALQTSSAGVPLVKPPSGGQV